ncbi:biogenesis of lysosome-related organelles complex 1 subunit 2-like [Saccoglossus kowalevskii]|uniref:Biogenesis of lysosome-related organelles complex 1 subunit 2-like n=1 Tax=Saccoglossus kowalevskii TaxID=10224 RepID=A0ABM0MZE4_SACKO|nr:PREDICTED: biogenesis of lysosome-related organelles complex 1 subunit 2-like [Saccoglossus kowalevskii]
MADAPSDASLPVEEDVEKQPSKKVEDGPKAPMTKATAEDYKLLEKMNQVTIQKYGDMRTITSNIATSMQNLNDKFKSLQPYLDQIDQVEESVANLEQAAYRLDAYSKRLELKFKQLEKR